MTSPIFSFNASHLSLTRLLACWCCCIAFNLSSRKVQAWSPILASTGISQTTTTGAYKVRKAFHVLDQSKDGRRRTKSLLNLYDRKDWHRSSRSSRRRQTTSDVKNEAEGVSGGDSTSSSSVSSSTDISWRRRLTREFVSIGGPALVQLAAEPLAALVDTAYLGRLGPEVLGGAGVAVSAQYAVSKLYNDPLLRTSISLVASQSGRSSGSITSSSDSGNSISSPSTDGNQPGDNKSTPRDADRSTPSSPAKELSVAVSSALLLAGTVGVIQWLVYAAFYRAITASMGVSVTSSMWPSAVGYLQVRAWGTPAATLWLVTNGIFRGLGDTRTPLIYSMVFTLLNIILDPIFIFTLGWGAAGAAAGTALAQYAALIPLLRALHRKVPIDVWGQRKELGSSLRQYLQAGSLVLARTFGKVMAYSVCARQAALLGSVAAAAYNLTFQLGFVTTQICEAVAVAVQTLMARELALSSTTTKGGRPTKAAVARHLISTSVSLGGTVAAILSLSTWFRRDWILAGLTTNPAVRQAAQSIFPVVLLTQVFKGLAYPVNGIIMGGLDWFYTMVVMWISNATCIGMIRWFGRGGRVVSLEQIWWALAAFMATQVVAGIVRYESRTGVWTVLRASAKEKTAASEVQT